MAGMSRADPPSWSRRSVLKVGAGAAAAVGSTGFGLGRAGAGGTSPSPSSTLAATTAPSSGPSATITGQAFASRPDLHPPRFEVLSGGVPTAEDGLYFTTPAKGKAQSGCMVLDGSGELVWFRPMVGGRLATNLRVQTYQGRPVLTWWEGVINEDGWGRGDVVIADDRYEELLRVPGGDGLRADLHDVQLTNAGTALVITYHPTGADLRSVGGSKEGLLLDSGFQELDLASGDVVMEWMGVEHLDLDETHLRFGQGVSGDPSPAAADHPFDFLHANSIAEDLDGNLLLSARHTFTIYKIERRTGTVLWRLGGRRSDFVVDPSATFAWQHDASRLADGRLSVFDNGAGISKTEPESRALLLDLDESARTASLFRAYPHPTSLVADSQGSAQLEADGDMVVGWGARPYLTRFGPDRSVRFDGRFLDDAASYRAWRSTWTAHPTGRPVLAVTATTPGLEVSASWNGATDVVTWVLQVGDTVDAMTELARRDRTGFETAISASVSTSRLAAVVALDAAGAELGRSSPARL